MAQDKTLSCRDCNTQFVFTAAEQDAFAAKGFYNAPSRCSKCRAVRQQRTGGVSRNDVRQPQRELHAVTCSACGRQTEVPFRPSGDRPVYCRDCFSRNNRR